MLLPAPPIDERSADGIVAESRRLAPFYTPEWNAPATQGAGFALLQNFAQLLFDVVQHLNLAPAKNFAAFLARLGITLQAARPARVLLTFSLAPGTPQDVFIPARTQAAAEATETRPEVVFETAQNVLATIATLQAVYSVRPSDDTIYEHLSELQNPRRSQLFAGRDLQEHSIYFAHSELFDLKTQAEMHVQFVIPAARLTHADFMNALSWEWWNKDHWVPSTVPAFQEVLRDFPAVPTLQSQISPTATAIFVTTNVESDSRFPEAGLLLIDNEIVAYTGKTANQFTGITRGWGSRQIPGASAAVPHSQGTQVRPIDFPLFVDAPPIEPPQHGRQVVTVTLKKEFDSAFTKSIVQGIENFWMRCRTLKSPVLKDSPLRNLLLDTVQASTESKTIVPDQLFFNDVPLDIPSQASPPTSISPFGQQPRPFDTFYVASGDAFSKRNATVTLDFAITIKGSLLLNIDPVFAWEYWNGTGWVRLAVTIEGIDLFKVDGISEVTFLCPDDIAAVGVNGQENFWIRVRIVGGSYGAFIIVDNNRVEASFRFPVVNSLTISYEPACKALDQCIIYNNLNSRAQTQNAQRAGTLFRPFEQPEEDRPTVYLGFDKPLVSGPIGIFFSLLKQEYLEETKPRLHWQYWNGSAWALLDVLDDTDNLTRSGLLQLVGPADLAASEKFGTQLFWLRAVDVENRFQSPPQAAMVRHAAVPGASGLLNAPGVPGIPSEKPCPELLELFHPKFSVPAALSTFPPPPILQGVFPNTTWALQAETIRDEILGSSDGQAHQQYTLMRHPVVSEEVWVNEINTLTEEEGKQLAAQDPQQIQEVRDEQGHLPTPGCAGARWRIFWSQLRPAGTTYRSSPGHCAIWRWYAGDGPTDWG